MIGGSARKGLEHQLLAVEHVDVHRCIGRSGGTDVLRRQAEQLQPPDFARESAPQRRYDFPRLQYGHSSSPAGSF
jgi:hypothetical protein